MGANRWSPVGHKRDAFLNIKAEGAVMVLFAKAQALTTIWNILFNNFINNVICHLCGEKGQIKPCCLKNPHTRDAKPLDGCAYTSIYRSS